jgi:antitoxin FitA
MLKRYCACMKAIQVRAVPDETHRVLRRRAIAAGMSLQEYLLAALKDLAARPTLEEVLGAAGQRSGGRVPLAAAARDVRADRGRP